MRDDVASPEGSRVEREVRPSDAGRAAFEVWAQENRRGLNLQYMYDAAGQYHYDGYIWGDASDAFMAWQAGAETERARADRHEATLRGMTRWLEKNQPDVFRRGLWDAIAAARGPNVRGEPTQAAHRPMSTETAPPLGVGARPRS